MQKTIHTHTLTPARRVREFKSLFLALPRPRYSESIRTCIEKQVAVVLYLGGVQSLHLCASYWCSGPSSFSGMAVPNNSIIARPYITFDARDHERVPPAVTWASPTTALLWAVLRKCEISFSGGAGEGNAGRKGGIMQASWCPRPPSSENHWRQDINAPMVCAYFGEIKRMDEAESLDWGKDYMEST